MRIGTMIRLYIMPSLDIPHQDHKTLLDDLAKYLNGFLNSNMEADDETLRPIIKYLKEWYVKQVVNNKCVNPTIVNVVSDITKELSKHCKNPINILNDSIKLDHIDQSAFISLLIQYIDRRVLRAYLQIFPNEQFFQIMLGVNMGGLKQWPQMVDDELAKWQPTINDDCEDKDTYFLALMCCMFEVYWRSRDAQSDFKTNTAYYMSYLTYFVPQSVNTSFPKQDKLNACEDFMAQLANKQSKDVFDYLQEKSKCRSPLNPNNGDLLGSLVKKFLDLHDSLQKKNQVLVKTG